MLPRVAASIFFLMSGFDDDRERLFKSKLSLDQALAIKVAARRNKMLARWVADRMALTGEAFDDYVKALVDAGGLDGDRHSLAMRVISDLLARGLPVSRREIEGKIARFTAKARAEVVRGTLG